ncbi:MAG: hypothetical protein P1P82_15820 [Bacteroidales bacterium]|nr:hypothetical protein [Bacteroidales bacterium]MDT8432890.1 hypothetical protein [Bacteroidales bacterium]
MKYSRLFLMAALALFMVEQVQAIPAFARKYGISCTMCHTPAAPKLKDYGDTFAGSGFKLNDYQAPRYFQDAGDDKLSLIRDFPIAVRLDGYIQAGFSGDGKVDMSAPYLVKLMSGGQLSEKLAYYFYFYMDEHGEIAGVEDAYVMYDNLFGTELDIYLGQFQVSDPLFKRELRLTFEDYHVYTSQIGLSDFNLKYDKGILLAYSLPTSTDITFEVVNGNGLSGLGEEGFFDKDPYKNYLGRISQDIGDFLRIGAMGYLGKEEIAHEMFSVTNQAWFAGPDATLKFSDKLEVNFQYVMRHDDEVLTGDGGNRITDITTNGMMGEVIYSPQGDKSNWFLVGLYNRVASDYDPADYHSATVHLGYVMRRNVRLGLEYTQVFTDPDDPFGRLSLGFVAGI